MTLSRRQVALGTGAAVFAALAERAAAWPSGPSRMQLQSIGTAEFKLECHQGDGQRVHAFGLALPGLYTLSMVCTTPEGPQTYTVDVVVKAPAEKPARVKRG